MSGTHRMQGPSVLSVPNSQQFRQRAAPDSQPSVCAEAQLVLRARLSATPVEGAGTASRLKHLMWLIKGVLEQGQGACHRGMALQVGAPYPYYQASICALKLFSTASQIYCVASHEAGSAQNQFTCRSMRPNWQLHCRVVCRLPNTGSWPTAMLTWVHG